MLTVRLTFAAAISEINIDSRDKPRGMKILTDQGCGCSGER